MFGTPSCPRCGSRFLVTRIRTTGALFAPSERYYRCFRCFEKFSPDREPVEEHPSVSDPDLPNEGRALARVVDSTLDLTPDGTKYAVEEFTVTIENRSDEPIRITQIYLAFDDGEERPTPKEEVVVSPDERKRIDIHWSWIHPEQRRVRIDVQSGGRTIASTTKPIDRAGDRSGADDR